ncbi:PREDICTED: osteoclast stimulatory transmembrane protein [Nanorana parkeri]|uniref:osteoclast stimulatory transmembrane protein n=1 Tax=Nanorana parkeri TaxID=125878 RepID=UPI000854254B|nr:PREDICTED: osteoclast stimulatory transmembrane protein [Nanorana parkeri]
MAPHIPTAIRNLSKCRSGWAYFQTVICPRVHTFALEVSMAYSVPVPRDWRQTLLLALTCSIISSLSGFLLFAWLFYSLLYDYSPAFVLSTTSALLLWGILVLVHPIRCVLTIMIPTLGTKQGSRLLLSTCFMVIALNIIPNILLNLKTIFQIFRCISQHSTEQLLNSTEIFRDLAHDVKNLVTSTSYVMTKTFAREVNIVAQVNASAVSNEMAQAANRLKVNFKAAESLFKDIMLMANRVMAGLFIVYTLVGAAWYLRSYLTNIKFDNKYITSQLDQLAKKNKVSNLTNVSSIKLIKSTGFKMSKKELGASLFQCLVILLFVLLTVMIITADHIVFQFAVVVSQWVESLPPLQVTFDLEYQANVNFLGAFQVKNVEYSRLHELTMTFFSPHCKRPARPPESSTAAAMGFIYCILFAMVFLEAYAQRLCRKISAMFYTKREEERVLYLLDQIQKKLQGGPQYPEGRLSDEASADFGNEEMEVSYIKLP